LSRSCFDCAASEPPFNFVYQSKAAHEGFVVFRPGQPVQLLPQVDGSVSEYVLAAPLPAGLVLDGKTGVISGSVSEGAASETCVVKAVGPGGSCDLPLRFVGMALLFT
jgi:hypothetical protein